MEGAASGGHATPFRFDQAAGPYAAGVRVVEQYDRSRMFRDSVRPVQTLIWYPAVVKDASCMTVRDYAHLWASETRFDQPLLPARAQQWLAAMRATLDEPLRAIRDAAEAPGRFPLVIYAPSFSSVAWENADLCEYLASHGFVVIASASLGARTRSMSTDLAGLDAQARDISFLIGYASGLANADSSQVAVAGFSWGGLANVFAAERDSRIRALVALDGSLRYWPGVVKQAGVCIDRMTVPLLSLAKTEWTLEEQARFLSPAQIEGPNVLNAWVHGDLLDVHMLGMTHRQFSSMAQRNEDYWLDAADEQFPDRVRPDFDRADAAAGYGWVARYTLEFLRAYLKREEGAFAFLRGSPAQNGVPKRFMTVEYRRAKAAEFERDEAALNDAAEELIDGARYQEAIALLKQNVTAQPDSAAAHAALARAYDLAGERDAAVDSYGSALAKNTFDAHARRRLRELTVP